jgi:hypothetical protein
VDRCKNNGKPCVQETDTSGKIKHEVKNPVNPDLWLLGRAIGYNAGIVLVIHRGFTMRKQNIPN